MKRNLNCIAVATLFLTALSLFLSIGCQQEIKDPGGNTNPNPPGNPGTSINDNIKVQASVRGIVVDEYNVPVQGATVTSGSITTTTDRYGSFRFSNISLSKENGSVRVSKSGYFAGTRTFTAMAGRTHNVRIKLLPKKNSGNFQGSAGGTINLGGGAKLVMPANAIADAGGGSYSGLVNVAMTWIDPTSTDLPYVVPGDLRGLTTTGEERGLSTYGMLGVELTGNSGQALKVATGQKAELSFPIPASIQGTAPATIDLWHFDESTSRWKQEGTATKNGNYYIAQVSHFSFWNCDAPFPLVNLCMTVIDVSENTALNNIQIRIKRSNGGYGYGRTDSAGNLCGKVPKDEALVLEVLGQCNNVVYSQNIGPFSADASLGTIQVTIPSTLNLHITGTVKNCSNANVTNGAAIIYTSTGNSYIVPVVNGIFSHTLIRCENATVNFSVIGVDYANLQQSNPVTGSGTTGIVNVGTIQACGTSSSQFIEFMVDGTPFTYAVPPDNITVSDSTTLGINTIAILGFKAPTNNSNYSSIRYQSNGSTGTQPLLQCRVADYGGFGVSEVITSPSPTVNITTFGPPGTGFIEGSFNVQMNFGGTIRSVGCGFRVRRL